MHSADDPLVLPGVANCLSRCLDPAAQGGLRYETPLPDRLVELILRDGAIAVLEEIPQEVENLRLDRLEGTLAAQLVPPRIQLTIGKPVDH